MASRKSRNRRLPVTKTMKAMKARVAFLFKKAMNMGKRATASARKVARRVSCRRSRR